MTATVKRALRQFLFALLAGALAACAQREPPFLLKNITGLMPPLQFALTDQDGRVVSAQTLRGRVALLYFGYTQCPDVCPTTLANLSRAIRMLGSESGKVRVLFVSVDPARDTQAVLKQYVANFGPEFVGLRGDDTALNALTRRYRIAYYREKPDAHGYYSVDHSSAVFVFDQRGHPRLLAEERTDAAAIAKDIRRLLEADAEST